MKLRRALAAVATTAAIAPAALLTAPNAFAVDASAPVPSAAAASAPSAATAPTTSVTPPAAPASGAPGTHTGGTPSSAPTSAPTGPGVCVVQNPEYKAAVHTAISGLPGKIARGSGWHTFTLSVDNPSSTNVTRIDMFAGVGPATKSSYAFATSQVTLQAYHPRTKRWEDITDGSGHSVGYFGWGTLPAHTHVNVPMRVEVNKHAPIGQGLTVGAGTYLDKRYDCVATSVAAYRIQIVAPGTKTTGSVPQPQPQTGGEAPVPAPKAAPSSAQKASTNEVTPASATSTDNTAGGQLAHTGASSALPAIAGAGAAAVVLGGGAVLLVRRRKGGSAA